MCRLALNDRMNLINLIHFKFSITERMLYLIKNL